VAGAATGMAGGAARDARVSEQGIGAAGRGRRWRWAVAAPSL
jgi:hypothetical protein